MVKRVICWCKKNDYKSVFSIFSLIPSFSQERIDPKAKKYREQGEKLVDSNEFDKAIRVYEKALSIQGNYSLAMSGIAYAYYKKNDVDNAIIYCNRAISADTSNERAYRYLGYIYADKNDWNRAIDYYTIAISIDDKMASAYSGRGLCYAELNSVCL